MKALIIIIYTAPVQLTSLSYIINTFFLLQDVIQSVEKTVIHIINIPGLPCSSASPLFSVMDAAPSNLPIILHFLAILIELTLTIKNFIKMQSTTLLKLN